MVCWTFPKTVWMFLLVLSLGVQAAHLQECSASLADVLVRFRAPGTNSLPSSFNRFFVFQLQQV